MEEDGAGGLVTVLTPRRISDDCFQRAAGMLEPLRNPVNWDNFRKGAVLVLIRGMLGPPYSDQYAPQRGWRCWPRQTVEDALRLKVTRDWSTFCILQAADYAKCYSP